MCKNNYTSELEKELEHCKVRIASLSSLYQGLIDNIPDGILLTSPDGRIYSANKAATKMFKMSEEEIVKLGRNGIVDLADPRLAKALELRTKTGKFIGELNLKRADGSVFPGEIASCFFVDYDGNTRTSMIIKDLSAQKLSEKIIKESENRFCSAFDSAPIGMALVALDGRCVKANKSFCDLFGYSEEQMREISFHEMTHPDDLEKDVKLSQKLVTGELESYRIEKRYFNKENQIIHASLNVSLIKKDNKPDYFIAQIVDLTNLRDMEQKYQTLFNEMIVGFALHEMIFDKNNKPVDYRFLAVNPAFKQMTGLNNKKIIGHTALEILPDLESYWIKIYANIIKTGKPASFENYSRELNKYFSVTAFKYGQNQFATMFVDVTERKNTEYEKERLYAQLLQAQKMESVGRLAGGVAHDFNNMLSLILGHAELAMDKIDTDHQLYRHLEEITAAGNRSAELTRQLLAFARKQPAVPKVIDLNDSIESMLKMLRRLIGEDIELRWQPQSKIWPIKIDPTQLDQILVNLSVNSRDAISGTGQITIETGNETIKNKDSDCIVGDFVWVNFSDNGCGIDEETQKYLFEPFFTTKSTGEGTGLGLATIYGIIKQNNGFIEVNSQLKKGTSFKIYFPRQSIAQENSTETEKIVSPTGNETILIVEDESPILYMARTMLSKLGYKVITATDPTCAIEIFAQNRNDINLVLTDIIMPDMSGKELANRINALDSNIKILFMSGYTADIIAHRGLIDKNYNFIQKPFSKAQLATSIRQILDNKM